MTELEALKLKHADVLNDPEVIKVAYWRQINTDNPIDEKKYTEKSKRNLQKFLDLLDKSSNL